MSLAGGKDFLVVTYREYDEVRFLWPVEDKIDREKTVKVLKPGAAAVSPDGSVCLLFQATILCNRSGVWANIHCRQRRSSAGKTGLRSGLPGSAGRLQRQVHTAVSRAGRETYRRLAAPKAAPMDCSTRSISTTFSISLPTAKEAL